MDYNKRQIGQRLQNARKAKRFTQDYVSEKIGINEKFLSQIECGKAGPSVKTLLDLCDILDVNPDYILNGTLHQEFKNPVVELIAGLAPEQQQDAYELLLILARAFKKND